MANCTVCGKKAFSDFCMAHKPRKAMTTTKPMNKVGKVTKQTNAAVAKWKRTQATNHQGYYECYICHKWVPYLMAEHVKSKARNPDRRTDLENLKPSCADCNREKGSKNN